MPFADESTLGYHSSNEPVASLWVHSIDPDGLRATTLRRALSLLTPEEQARAARLRSVRHRSRWIMAHALLRGELAAYLGCAPEMVRYVYSPAGRPSLQPTAALPHPADFNLSHSGDTLLLGITGRGRIGVDIEAWDVERAADREPVWETLSDRETEWVRTQGDRFAAFVRLWTRKEAVVKATGAGLPDHLEEIDVLSPRGSSEVLIRMSDELTVRVVDVPAPRGFHAAVALTMSDTAVQVVATAPRGSHTSHLLVT